VHDLALGSRTVECALKNLDPYGLILLTKPGDRLRAECRGLRSTPERVVASFRLHDACVPLLLRLAHPLSPVGAGQRRAEADPRAHRNRAHAVASERPPGRQQQKTKGSLMLNYTIAETKDIERVFCKRGAVTSVAERDLSPGCEQSFGLVQAARQVQSLNTCALPRQLIYRRVPLEASSKASLDS